MRKNLPISKVLQKSTASRKKILEAAESLFVRNGVSRTTLHQIAVEAGMSRGAIYWHFKDKSALVAAIMQRAILPLDAALHFEKKACQDDPLTDLKQGAMEVFSLMLNSPKARRALQIATHKIEYIDELKFAGDGRTIINRQWLPCFEERISVACEKGLLKRFISPHLAALSLWTMLDGLLRLWLSDSNAFDLLTVGGKLVDAQLESIRAGEVNAA
jgi:TetR/AcrR family acrAB operon transcriptional repressor